jgi:hypothetical protein
MTFSETASLNRKIVRGVAPVQITLAGTVATGDPIMYSSGWKLAANTSGAPAVLFAGQPGVSGDIITAYPMAVVEMTHTAANVPTMGMIIAVADAGTYAPAGSGLQDIGYVIEIDSDNLHSRAQVMGMITEVDTAGT